MKRLLIILLALVLLLAAGCQKTPESAIVVGKSNDALIEKAQGDAGEGTLAQRLGAPETYQSTVSSQDGKLTVTVDAAVTVPDAEAAPILRVTPAEITQDQSDILMDTLVQGPLYAETTKEQIMLRILEAKRELAAGEPPGNNSYIIGDEEVSFEQWMQDIIDRYYDEYAAAPAASACEPISGQFQKDRDGDSRIYGLGLTEEYGYEKFSVWNAGVSYTEANYSRTSQAHSDGGGYTEGVNYTTPDRSPALFENVDLSAIPDIAVTEEEAVALCGNVVAALGLEDMTLCSARKEYASKDPPDHMGWIVRYTRAVNGVPVTYTDVEGLGEGGAESEENGSYQVSWPYERLAFLVNDAGLAAMNWDSPYAIGETVTADSALLPFSDVMDIFEKMCLVEHDGLEGTVKVEDIRLGYTRIRERDKRASGLLVPAWDFFGVMEYADRDRVSDNDPDRSFLTINAVDGSIIDRNQGY